MSAHLSPEQFVDAVDGAVTAEVRRHVDACATCRHDLATLERAMRDVQQATDVPEPSPLFWDHFSARVRAATEDVTVPSTSWTWTGWRRPAVAFAAAALLLTFLVARRAPVQGPGEPGGTAGPVTPTGVATLVTGSSSFSTSDTDPAWELVVTMASGLSSEDIHEITPPAVAASDLVLSLTPAERETFVRLVKREMGGLE